MDVVCASMCFAQDRDGEEWLKRVHVFRADAPSSQLDKQLTELHPLSRRRTWRGGSMRSGRTPERMHAHKHMIDHHHARAQAYDLSQARAQASSSTSKPTHAHKLKSILTTTHCYANI